MKKTLNEAAISNELREGSAFFRKPNEKKPQSLKVEENNIRSDDTYVTHVTHDTNVTKVTDDTHDTYVTEKPVQRQIERRPLEIYIDQHKTLQTLKARSVLEGSPKTMGDLVREALDEYFVKKGVINPKQ